MLKNFSYINNNSTNYHNCQQPQERELKRLLQQGKLSDAVDFLEKMGVRRETTVRIFAKLTSGKEVTA